MQSNQYPRALDIARPFRAAGIAVAIGGFHVSGCLSMLDGRAVELDACREHGHLHVRRRGRGPARQRCCAMPPPGRLAPLYNFMKDLPGMEGTPVPFLPKRYVERTLGLSASFDAGRGCPYQCSFCTIINVQGRKSRYRSADDVEHLVRLNWAQGIHKFFITDDNFARNKEWEAIFDRLIELREKDGIPLGLMIQVDTLCHKIPNFVEKAKRAGVTRVFIGLENINPDNLAAAKKRQNKITEYRKMLLAWKAQGIMTLARLYPRLSRGHAGDDPARHRDHPEGAAARHSRVLLPDAAAGLGGPPGALEARASRWMPTSTYTTSSTSAPPIRKMSKQEWEAIYQEAWSLYYTPEHMKTLLRRAAATGVPMGSLVKLLVTFATTVRARERASAAERHPPPQAPLGAPPRPAARKRLGILAALRVGHAHASMRSWPARSSRLLLGSCDHRRSERAKAYTDQALTPVRDDEDETLDLFTKTTGARRGRPRQEGRRADRRRPDHLTSVQCLLKTSSAAEILVVPLQRTLPGADFAANSTMRLCSPYNIGLGNRMTASARS